MFGHESLQAEIANGASAAQFPSAVVPRLRKCQSLPRCSSRAWFAGCQKGVGCSRNDECASVLSDKYIA